MAGQVPAMVPTCGTGLTPLHPPGVPIFTLGRSPDKANMLPQRQFLMALRHGISLLRGRHGRLPDPGSYTRLPESVLGVLLDRGPMVRALHPEGVPP